MNSGEFWLDLNLIRVFDGWFDPSKNSVEGEIVVIHQQWRARTIWKLNVEECRITKVSDWEELNLGGNRTCHFKSQQKELAWPFASLTWLVVYIAFARHIRQRKSQSKQSRDYYFLLFQLFWWWLKQCSEKTKKSLKKDVSSIILVLLRGAAGK